MTELSEEDKLYDKLGDIRFDLMEEVNHLIEAKWDSKTLEKKIEKLVNKTWKIHEKIEKLKVKEFIEKQSNKEKNNVIR